MKTPITPLLVTFCILFTSCSTQKKGQTFYVFGAKIPATDVVGTPSFEDVGIKFHTTVIPNLSEDTTTTLLRMGTVRVNSSNYKDGTYPLFSLSTREKSSGYPLLDSIDREYYLSYGHQIIELKNPAILNDVKYQNLLEILHTKSPLEFRTALFSQYAEYRDLFINSRYFINDQIISDTVVKAVLKETHIDLSTSTSIDQIVSNAIATSNDSNRPSDSAKLSVLIKKVLNQYTGLHGLYRSVSFRQQYVDIVNEIITNFPEEKINPTDIFEKNLKFYINSRNNALNTFIAAFKFAGQFNSEKTVYDSLKGAIQLQFHFADSQAASVAAAVSHQYVKNINENFSNSFNKLWIIIFGTDQLMDKLVFKGKRPEKELSSKEKANIINEAPYYPIN